MHVLVIEDQWLIAADLIEALEAAGHQVVGPALDSMQALTLATNEHPQLALIDIDLEKRGIGIEVAERLHDELGITVIFMTGQVELARRCDFALGLISKPYDTAQAAAAVGVIEIALQAGNDEFSGKPDSLEIFESKRPH